MEKFTKLISRAVPLATENIDTDQIIPARFLKATDTLGFGDNVFKIGVFTKTEASIKVCFKQPQLQWQYFSSWR